MTSVSLQPVPNLCIWFLTNIKIINLAMRWQENVGTDTDKKKTECVVKTHDRSETFVLQRNIIIIHQSLLNSIFTTKLYILMKKLNYKQR
jgi:hypothetical protein